MSIGGVYRTTPDKVQGIIEVSCNTEDLIPYIEVANELVTERCVNPPYGPNPEPFLNDGDGRCNRRENLYLANDPQYIPYTAVRLELIERWLAAHFYTVFDPRTESEGAGQGRARFEGKTAMYLQSSKYGQHACLLDTNGSLAELSRRTESATKVRLISIGKKYIRGRYFNNGGYFDF
jgi:hypothetical protein